MSPLNPRTFAAGVHQAMLLMNAKSHRRKLTALLIGFLVGAAAMADTLKLEIIELRHSLITDVLPLVKPLVAPDGTATGMQNKLIVKSTPANIAEIKRVLAAIDRPPKTLRITVRQDVSGNSRARQDALSGRVGTGSVEARVPDPGGRGGASVGLSDADGNAIRYRSISTRSSGDSNNAHFVTALEGRPALIHTGQSIPYPSQSASYGRHGVVVNQGLDYRDVNSGFYVTPRLNGEQVTLEIAPQLERADPRGGGAIDTRYAETTARGRLGEWIPLGGASQTSAAEDSALLARTRRRGEESYDVWVKVEEVD